jgi:two-component system OmpR family response regulator
MDRPFPRALIVDDDPAVAKLLSRCLSQCGWDANMSPSVPMAMEQFAEREYALAVCDVNVGTGDGIGLAKELLKKKPSLFVIIASGKPENLERARAEGFARCLQKPFTMEEFQALVGQYDKAAPVSPAASSDPGHHN